MHAAIAAQAHQMQAMSLGVLHGREQDGILKEVAGSDHLVDARDVHVDDSAGADVQMPDFAVAHLALGQTDVTARGVHQGVRKFTQQHVVGRLARGGDRIAFRDGGVTPAIQDGEDERLLLAVHYWWNAFRPANFAASPSSSSMRRSWLYFAMRSVRLADPVLICPARVATARSAMKASSVSPDRCETTLV